MSLRASVFIKCGLAISVLSVFPGCASREKTKNVSIIRMDPEGSLEEQLAFHLFEMKKYEAAALEENQKALAYLKKENMNEVRQASSRRAHYLKKAEEHSKFYEELSKTE
jgi:hypothetical protein